MGKYLTEFSSNTAYNAALATLDYPNVSLVENQLKYAESLPTMYRWVDDGDNTRCGDDIEYDSCTLYQQTKKQMSINGGQTWTDVIPREYGYGDVIEEESSECGCGDPFGCREIDLADDQGDSYYGELVQGIKFGHMVLEPNMSEYVYIWDYYESAYIGKIHFETADSEDDPAATVTIYDDSDTLIATLNDYAEWDDWVRLCEYFDGICMKLSLSQEDEDQYPYDGFPIIIKIGNDCDCSCLDE